MDFKFPPPQAVPLANIMVPKDVAIVAFHQATNASLPLAKESYLASFEGDKIHDGQITVLVLAKWIRAYYESTVVAQ
jgi:hypothetical protein